MGDRELLELAAKAAGIELEPDGFIPQAGSYYAKGMKNLGGIWSPLTDDGDTLRLYVAIRKFEPQINIYNDGSQVETMNHLTTENCALDGDHGAALRRAVTTAAAKIGKAMTLTYQIPSTLSRMSH